MKLTSMIPRSEGLSSDERITKIEECLQRLAQELDFALANLDERNFSEQGLLAVRGEQYAAEDEV